MKRPTPMSRHTTAIHGSVPSRSDSCSPSNTPHSAPALIDPARANAPSLRALPRQRHNLLFQWSTTRKYSLRHSKQLQFLGSKADVQGMGLRAAKPRRAFHARQQIAQALDRTQTSLHTIIPAFMQNEDQHMASASMGGMNSPWRTPIRLQYVDYKMNIQAALEEPRLPSTQNSAATS